MQAPILIPEKIPFIAKNFQPIYILNSDVGNFEISAVSMGNPHCIIEVDDVSTIDIEKIGNALSHHSSFPEQANIEFMQIIANDEIKLRIYERGAGETQACGSGACAAVVAGRLRNQLAEKVKVNMPGGQLKIAWQKENEPVWMNGPAVKVFDGVINL
jgi:diaminopimelate epimerase